MKTVPMESAASSKTPSVPAGMCKRGQSKDAYRDAARVAAGLCVAHGCPNPPMPDYRKCKVHHRRARVRERKRYFSKPRVSKLAARREAVALGKCVFPACMILAVKWHRCIFHLSSHQKYLIRPKVLKSSGRKPAEDCMYSKGPEYGTVVTHRRSIALAADDPNLASYIGMPFYPAWDFKSGGSYAAGAKWIIENLGHKPSTDYDMHIIDRRLGFVPGNLAWVPRSKHKREELVTKLLIENQELKARIRQLEKL